MKRIVFMVLAVVMAIALVGCGQNQQPSSPSNQGGTSAPSTDEFSGVTLKALSFLPTNHPLVATIPNWIEKVEEATDGKVKINWIGGPEATPESEQFTALRNGVIDVNFPNTSMYGDQVPEARTIQLSQLKPWEERESGFYDKLFEAHEAQGVIYLGRFMSNELPFYLWFNDPFESLADLKGRKMRSHVIYNALIEAHGMVPSFVAPSDVYTALQQGIVEGFGWGGLLGPRVNGWTDSSKYVLDHPFYNQNGTILMRKEAWDKIPAEYQQKIIEATAEYEREMDAYFAEESAKERQELEAIGVQFIKLPGDEGEKFVQVNYDAAWAELEQDLPGVEELRSLSSK